MVKINQSIEDLIHPKKASNQGESTVQEKFSAKQREIKNKEVERVVQAEADASGFPYINLFGFPISPEALSLLTKEEVQELSCLCFFYDGTHLRFGAVNPNDVVVAKVKEMGEKYFCDTQIYRISDVSFNYTLGLYDKLPKIREVVKGVNITEEDLDKYNDSVTNFKKLQGEVEKNSLTEVVTIVMAASIKSGASDVHIEAEEHQIKVRFRIDGILNDVLVLNKDVWPKMISRFKMLSGVKMNISDKPQDGRISIFTKKERIDIRVSFLPTNYGESVVMRLLRSGSVSVKFEDLGFSPRAFETLAKQIARPNGMVITTGPTGSGKTTTLYAILKKLNDSETKIVTMEDPIEYQLEGINQSQTSERYTFAQGLRSIMRQDPDVIMVGEIRDLETAEISIQAALTGHMVLSTIHTNDAAGTIPRFLSMGAKPFLLAPALNAMIGQRLVRKICEHCKEEIIPDEAAMTRVKGILNDLPESEKKEVNFDNLKFYHGKGCDFCQGLGYKGRLGIYEILTMNAEIEKILLAGNVSEYEMRDIAHRNGVVSMVQDGILKAVAGLTSLEEVFRVAE